MGILTSAESALKPIISMPMVKAPILLFIILLGSKMTPRLSPALESMLKSTTFRFIAMFLFLFASGFSIAIAILSTIVFTVVMYVIDRLKLGEELITDATDVFKVADSAISEAEKVAVDGLDAIDHDSYLKAIDEKLFPKSSGYHPTKLPQDMGQYESSVPVYPRVSGGSAERTWKSAVEESYPTDAHIPTGYDMV